MSCGSHRLRYDAWPRPSGGTAYAVDSKSIVRKDMRVRIPPRAPISSHRTTPDRGFFSRRRMVATRGASPDLKIKDVTWVGMKPASKCFKHRKLKRGGIDVG